MPFPKPNRAMLFDSAGWPATSLGASCSGTDRCCSATCAMRRPWRGAIVQAALTALAALVLVLLARRTAPLRRRTGAVGGVRRRSSLAIVVAALAGFGRAPMGWMLIAFALSGRKHAASRMGRAHERAGRGAHRRDAQGRRTCSDSLLFALISLLPALSVLAVSVLLPFGAFGLLEIAVRGERERGASEVRMLPASLDGDSLRVSLSRVPWKPMAAISLAFFGYGATRANGVIGGFEVSSEFHGALAGVPALASFVAILLAYLFYRKNAMLAFYLAFPLMAMASLLPASLDPFGGRHYVQLCGAGGAELVKYLVWFLFIDSFFKDAACRRCCAWRLCDSPNGAAAVWARS